VIPSPVSLVTLPVQAAVIALMETRGGSSMPASGQALRQRRSWPASADKAPVGPAFAPRRASRPRAAQPPLARIARTSPGSSAPVAPPSSSPALARTQIAASADRQHRRAKGRERRRRDAVTISTSPAPLCAAPCGQARSRRARPSGSRDRASRRLQGGLLGVQNRGAAYAKPVEVTGAPAPRGALGCHRAHDPDVAYERSPALKMHEDQRSRDLLDTLIPMAQ
jgi:hypothetical protein